MVYYALGSVPLLKLLKDAGADFGAAIEPDVRERCYG
jgi:hypothetical protein